jgi:uncharacterized protein (TIGR03382 family)
MNVGDGANVAFAQAATKVTHSIGTLNLNNTGTLDVGNHTLMVGTTDSIRTYVARAAGPTVPNGENAWTGAGLTSSKVAADAAAGNAKGLALGYWDSRDNAQTGQSVPAGQTMVHYTVYGDATGDGLTDIRDFAVWNNNFFTGNRWSQGDFNYDGKIDIRDFAVWNNNFFNKAPANGSSATGAAKTTTAAAAVAAAPVVLTSAATTATPATPAAAAPGTLELDVNPTTGDAVINSGGLAINGIQISSDTNQLVPANWKSLGSFYHLGQFAPSRGSPASNFIAEVDNSGNFTTLASGSTIDYGNIFTPGGTPDLVFVYTYQGPGNINQSAAGLVVYQASGVPEPTMLALGGVAALGLLGRRRRLR